MLTLYNLRHSGDQYRVTKFIDGNPETTYLTDGQACDCPAGVRPTCRHRQMFHNLLPIVNTDLFLNWDHPLRPVTDFMGMIQPAPAVFAKPIERTVEPVPLPPGVQIHIMDVNDDPGLLYNLIADAVGEPRLPLTPQPFKRRI